MNNSAHCNRLLSIRNITKVFRSIPDEMILGILWLCDGEMLSNLVSTCKYLLYMIFLNPEIFIKSYGRRIAESIEISYTNNILKYTIRTQPWREHGQFKILEKTFQEILGVRSIHYIYKSCSDVLHVKLPHLSEEFTQKIKVKFSPTSDTITKE
jgi:hypothetical protein